MLLVKTENETATGIADACPSDLCCDFLSYHLSKKKVEKFWDIFVFGRCSQFESDEKLLPSSNPTHRNRVQLELIKTRLLLIESIVSVLTVLITRLFFWGVTRSAITRAARGCSTPVEHMPCDPEVVGLNTIVWWAFFLSILSVLCPWTGPS